MHKNEKLIESITNFFMTIGKRDGYCTEHIISLLRDIRFTALYHAICENASPVFAFSAGGDAPGKLHYRSAPLFPGNATLLWTERTYHVSDELLDSSRYLEVWVKEDMSPTVVACFRTVFDDEDYVTEYREIKEDGWPITDALPDIEELFYGIQDMYPAEFDPDVVIIYES